MSNHSFKILLVENSRTSRAVLLRQLEPIGAITAVGSGLEAIEAIKKSEFHVVIMDVFLPEMNGYEATKHIRSETGTNANIPIVGFTSSTNERDKKTCLEAGMTDYIIKSDDNLELTQLLEQYKKAWLNTRPA